MSLIATSTISAGALLVVAVAVLAFALDEFGALLQDADEESLLD